MPEIKTNPYEAMFLFPQSAASNLQGAVDHINEILRRADATLISLRKWDERRLAFVIQGNKRGIYFLAYFTAKSDRLAGIERDCNLSEQVLRVLITRADHLDVEQMKASDGRQQLEDEIRLRSEQPEGSDAADSSGEQSEVSESAEAEVRA